MDISSHKASTLPATVSKLYADWGTTNLRAYALDEQGSVVTQRESAMGVRGLAQEDFPDTFDRVFGAWRSVEALPTLLSGMIGSRMGWIEAPYVPCPATMDDIVESLALVPDRDKLRIVPGVCIDNGPTHRDVMRGEEVQVFGALSLAETGSATLCLPGTHSKWVEAEDHTIRSFRTAMTGELFDLLSRYSTLAVPGNESDPADSAAFDQGYALAGSPGGLLNHLFSVRANALFATLAPDQIRAYLSGILIGHELADLGASHLRPDVPILLVGDRPLSKLYSAAMERAGLDHRLIDCEQAVIRGLDMVFAQTDWEA
jgi:2-dehydro-3-deoxygalactonokinase